MTSQPETSRKWQQWIAILSAIAAFGLALAGGRVLSDPQNEAAFGAGLLLLALAIPVFWLSLALNRAPNEYFAPVLQLEPPLTRWHWFAVVGGLVALFLLEEVNSNLLGLQDFLPTNEHLQFGLLVGGSLALAWGFSGGWQPSLYGRVLDSWADVRREQWLEIAGVIALTLLALALRCINLEGAIPAVVDEISFTAVIPMFEFTDDVLIMQPLNNIAAFPRLYPYFQWISVEVFGRDLNALRLVSALFGALTIPALYWLGKHLFDRRIGAVAALVLATLPVHLQLSRIGLNNVADPFFGILTFALLARGLRYGGRANFALAGVTLGWSQYFHEAGRLTFPVIAVVWMALLLIRTRNPVLRRNLLVTVFCAVILALPVYTMLQAMDLPFAARVSDVGLQSDYWQSLNDVGQFTVDLGQRIGNALGRLLHHPERVLYYAGETPYLLTFVSPFLTIGLAYVLWRWTRPGAALVLLWLVIPFGGIVFFLAEIMSARTTVLLPPFALLTAVGIVYGLRAILETRPVWLNRLIVLIVACICLVQTVYYFSFHLPVYRQQLFTTEAWQQTIFVPRQLPDGTQIHLFMPNLPDQNYLNQVYRFIGGAGYIAYTHDAKELTPGFLRTLSPVTPQALIVMNPDEATRRMLLNFQPGMPAPTLLNQPDVKPWFLVYLRP